MNKLSGILFDIDGTLTESKQALSFEMATLLGGLINRLPVALVSGAGIEQMKSQIVAHLPPSTLLSNLTLFPTSGARALLYEDNTWKDLYVMELSDEEKKHITEVFEPLVKEVTEGHALFGNQIEDRTSSIAISLLGQEAPLEAKKTFDPDQKIRQMLVARATPQLPGFCLRLGGMTTIDITKIGIDKAYAVQQFANRLEQPIESCVYVGDALFEGGNDAAVFRVPVQTHAVKNVQETADFIRDLLIS